MVDFNDFHRSVLPRAPRLQEAAQSIGPDRSFAFQMTDGARWCYESNGKTLKISERAETADVVVELDEDAFADFVSERQAVVGLFYANRLRVIHGNFNRLMGWEPALQAIYFDRPIWSKNDIGRLGAINIRQSFSMRDIEKDPSAAKSFLLTTGFLHVREVFTAAEVSAFKDECERQVALATPPDGRSWWATNSAGTETCCRVTYLNRTSELVRNLPADKRLLALAALANDKLVWGGDRMDGVSVVIKNPDIVEGMSDLPWHRDCGSGGHHLICPGLNVGVQLDKANAENGQLKFLAGSWEHANYPLQEDDPDLPIVAIDAQPGDVSVHFCHTMHVAPPPTSQTANRRVLYCSYYEQKLLDAIPQGKSYNDVLFTQGDGRVRTPQEESAKR